MDIFPTSVNIIINCQGVSALSQKIQNLEYIDLAEKAIKALEKISSESAVSVLANANLDAILNIMDFFDLSVQTSIFRMLSNICFNLNREDDLRKLMPMIPTLTNLFEIRGTSDKHSEIFELMCASFQSICDSPLRFKDPYTNFAIVSKYYEEINAFGLMDK